MCRCWGLSPARRELKERVKIVGLIKGSWVPLRLHVQPHPSHTHPHSSRPHLPASRRIYYPPLSAGPLRGPPFLHFMPWVNLLVPSNGGCWASLKWPADEAVEKWIWNSGRKDRNGVEKQTGSEMNCSDLWPLFFKPDCGFRWGQFRSCLSLLSNRAE